LLPLMQGMLADGALGLKYSYILPLICYLFIFYYGFIGHKPAAEKLKL